MSIQRFARTLWCALRTPGTHVPIAHGNPGSGKTTVMGEVVVQGLGIDPARYYTLIAAQQSPETFGGWGVPRPQGLTFEAPARIRELADPSRGAAAINLDELGNAPRSVQGAMLHFMHARACGDQPLGDHLLLMGTTNPPATGTDPQEFGRAFSNRGVWIEFPGPSREEHAAYLASRGRVEFGFPAFDRAAWDEAYDEVAAIYAAYLLNDPQARLDENPESEAVAERWPCAYATPRSWETAVRLAATCRMAGDDEAMLELLQGTVGKPQGLAFAAAYHSLDLVPFETVRRDHAAWRPNSQRPDRTFAQAQLVALAAARKDLPKPEQVLRWNDAMGFLEYVVVGCGEPAAMCATACSSLLAAKPASAALAPFAKLVFAMEPVIRAAGWRV